MAEPTTGLKTAITKAMNDYKKDRSSQGKDKQSEGSDYRGRFGLLLLDLESQKLICSLKDKPKTN